MLAIILCDAFGMFGSLPLLPVIYGSQPIPRIMSLPIIDWLRGWWVLPADRADPRSTTNLNGPFQVAVSSYLDQIQRGASNGDAFKGVRN